MICLLNKIDQTLVTNIRAELSRRNWKRADLARQLGCEPMVVSRLLNEARWSTDLLAKIAEVFECAPSDLIAENKTEPDSPLVAVVELYSSIPRLKENEVQALLISVRTFLKRRTESQSVEKDENCR